LTRIALPIIIVISTNACVTGCWVPTCLAFWWTAISINVYILRLTILAITIPIIARITSKATLGAIISLSLGINEIVSYTT
jgi:hypothetical protein